MKIARYWLLATGYFFKDSRPPLHRKSAAAPQSRSSSAAQNLRLLARTSEPPFTLPASVSPALEQKHVVHVHAISHYSPHFRDADNLPRPVLKPRNLHTILIALASCCRMTRDGISTSDISTIASSRENASRGLFACTVLIDPRRRCSLPAACPALPRRGTRRR